MLTGCGGGGDEPAQTKVVTTMSYSFQAPEEWRQRAGARTLTLADGRGSVVAVTTFRLAQPFRPELWERAVPELDRVAAALARELGGRIVARRSATVAEQRARIYDVEGAEDGTRRVGFVLRGRQEFQLLCRWPADGDAAACDAFFASFRLR